MPYSIGHSFVITNECKSVNYIYMYMKRERVEWCKPLKYTFTKRLQYMKNGNTFQVCSIRTLGKKIGCLLFEYSVNLDQATILHTRLKVID